MAEAREDRQIAHASFWYADSEGYERIAMRGDTVTLSAEDIERGDAHGAFVTDGSEEQADLSYDPKTATIDEVLAYVGEDQVRASDALEYENEKGDKARKSLVKALNAIANPDAGDADGD